MMSLKLIRIFLLTTLTSGVSCNHLVQGGEYFAKVDVDWPNNDCFHREDVTAQNMMECTTACMNYHQGCNVFVYDEESSVCAIHQCPCFINKGTTPSPYTVYRRLENLLVHMQLAGFKANACNGGCLPVDSYMEITCANGIGMYIDVVKKETNSRRFTLYAIDEYGLLVRYLEFAAQAENYNMAIVNDFLTAVLASSPHVAVFGGASSNVCTNTAGIADTKTLISDISRGNIVYTACTSSTTNPVNGEMWRSPSCIARYTGDTKPWETYNFTKLIPTGAIVTCDTEIVFPLH